ncbi:class I SAM-dependent methyltransferase [Legionella sp. km772]|uniref:class I SAM-dependent methyltransferase n=1 Tax=Legionella sp. km772 TaxID=2498111 RepID=UPI00131552A8|nr:class I SAM-dependent methyltransferase [Legionella sp. km772]
MPKTNSYEDATHLINQVLDSNLRAEGKDNLAAKEIVQQGYAYIANNIYNRTFLNWGLWDKQIYKEFSDLHYNFAALCPYQSAHSPLLIYYVLRPLIQQYFFGKRILEVGPGNGIGLKMSSQLLKSNYALGIDLTHPLVRNAKNNFSMENKVDFIQGDAEHLPLENESFDLITNIESSHLYPNLELFFHEVCRVLIPGGFFCYTDIELKNKLQSERLDNFLKSRNDIRVVLKQDLTKLVQNSIYMKLIKNEKKFVETCITMFGTDPKVLAAETTNLANSMGMAFLPWWKIWVKTPIMRPIAKAARNDTYWGKKLYFYYLLQKI